MRTIEAAISSLRNVICIALRPLSESLTSGALQVFRHRLATQLHISRGAAMQRHTTRKHRWGVILAGGEGVRLRSLTRLVSHDGRPKQFCPLLGDKTLLAQTRTRIARSVSPRQSVFVVLRSHKPFYAQELRRIPSSRMVVQPSNRGTLPAILCSLLRILRLDE